MQGMEEGIRREAALFSKRHEGQKKQKQKGTRLKQDAQLHQFIGFSRIVAACHGNDAQNQHDRHSRHREQRANLKKCSH
tara:strand:+ start:4167 stop:4403 length:237 start_codon:yes stop_codon:yes gene_type:complete